MTFKGLKVLYFGESEVAELVNARVVKVKRMVGKKVVHGKEYKYEYYTLPLLLYVPKHVAEKTKEFIVERYDDGSFVIKPKVSKEQREEN